MKFLSLLIWVTQFGFSVVFPLCFFLVLGAWLQDRFDLGMWIMAVCGILGLGTTVSTTCSCIRSLRREAENHQTEEKDGSQ